MGANNVASRVSQVEIQIAASSSAISNITSPIQEIEMQVGGKMDTKIAAAVAALTASGGMPAPQQHTNWSSRSILERKAVQDIVRFVDAKVIVSGIGG